MSELDTSAVDPTEFARNLALATDAQLDELMAGPMREQILEEIFSRMEQHFRADAASDTDAVIHWRGPWDFAPWRQAPLLASALRVLAVCILGPTAEELIFRSLFFNWLSKRLPMLIVVGTTAVSWAFLHYTYSWSVIAIIVVDGILLGLARWKTGSVVPTILMHAAYNFYAIW
jgi:hypothetical protein